MRGVFRWAPTVAGAVLISSSLVMAMVSGPASAAEPWVKEGPDDAQVAAGYGLSKVFSDKGVWYNSFTLGPDGRSVLALTRVDDPKKSWDPKTTVVHLVPGAKGRLKPTTVLEFEQLRVPGLWSDGIDLQGASIQQGAGNGGARPISLAPNGDLLIAATASTEGQSIDQTVVWLHPDGSTEKVISSADLVVADVFGEPVSNAVIGVAAVTDHLLFGRTEGWTPEGDGLQRLVQVVDPDGDGDWSDRAIRPIVLPDSVPAVEDAVYDWSYGGFVQLPADLEPAGTGTDSVLLPVYSRNEYRVYRLTDVGDDGIFTEPGEAELVFSSQVEPGSLDLWSPPQLGVIDSTSGPAFVLVGLTNPSRVSITEDGVARDVVRGLFGPSGPVVLADGSILIGNQAASSGGPARQPYSILRLVADDAPPVVPTDTIAPARAGASPGRKLIPRAPIAPDVPRVAAWVWAASKDGEDAEMLLFYGADGSGPRDVLPGAQEVWSSPCQSADGTAAAAWAEVDVPNEHALYLFDTPGSAAPALVTERSGTISCPFPEGVMAFTDEPASVLEPVVTMSRLDLGGDAEPTPLVQTRHGLCSAVTSDGRFLAVPNEDGTGLSVVDVVEGSVRPIADGLGGTVVRSAWSPDGSRLAMVTGPYDPMQIDTSVTGAFDVSVVDVSTEASKVSTSPRTVFSLEGPSPSIAWSSDGRRLAVLGREQEADCGCERAGTLTIVDADTGATRIVAPDASFVEWSPVDPGILAWGDRARLIIETDGLARAVDAPVVKTDDGKKPASWSGSVGWSPDGRYLLFGIPRLMTVDTANDQTRIILTESDDLSLISTEWWR